MKKTFSIIDKFEEMLLVILMVLMTASVVIQVFSRTILHSSPAWSEEVARYMLVWITFVGASLGIKKGAHIGVEAFTMLLPGKFKKAVQTVTIGFCTTFTLAVLVESIKILILQIETGQVSAAIQIPMWLPYAGVSVGMFLMTIRFVEKLLIVIRGEEVSLIE